MAMSEVATGTKGYMDLYPEQTTDGQLRLGNIVPDFSCETTITDSTKAGCPGMEADGKMKSFHEWKKGRWGILFSHPADFTPVCTTEIGRLALKFDELQKLDCALATLSVDPVKSHDEWLTDVVAHCENKIEIKFPIIGDSDRKVSTAYGMLDKGKADHDGVKALPLTIRAVFIMNPENKLMCTLNYPACVGRNMDEILRIMQALQLSYEKSVATPANWPNNHADMPDPRDPSKRTTDFKGSVFLLPTVTPEEAAKYYPTHAACPVPSDKKYLRLVPTKDIV
eukprot:gnl/TRDRNA2_/TRDRNA2_168269_c0_seq1.p2 gnl/TRDRNA2_/TRDRNA2_168269_c0~~gnl/TRDRNA2_/TRDRNA2_168269_c0_seq1.p2  ORF type:complete len:282 (-),score=72.42 gnl/TRDRNA2_/TRDRNA2_168269_c0_seq1:111-956(-)